MCPIDSFAWKDTALQVLKAYTRRTDGSWIEDKEYGIVWHFENADPEYGRMQASEVSKYLIKVMRNPQVQVVLYDYQRILEVKPRGVSKGSATTRVLKTIFSHLQEKLDVKDDKGSDVISPMPASTTSTTASTTTSTTTTSTASTATTPATSTVSPTTTSTSDTTSTTTGVSTSPTKESTELTKLSLPHERTDPEDSGSPPSKTKRGPVPFLLGIGDDKSDEDMFVALQRGAEDIGEIGRAVQQECRDRSRMPSSA
eukprot:TRINITY_DN5690_c0_g1_i15.p1 TRINITY_DN5690_c0_g1~~TRINITY_DN5690_c0_g1_i15.p1  ORF type:complete len:283 (+),score=32.66 TRINITY_DN5690_c0_g1_i15:82-849(+)